MSLNSLSSLNSDNDIETITQRIETTHTDIAPTYPQWRDLGFALADTLGESGRNYYHRLSRFYPTYNPTETDTQFTNCLKSNKHGITIKTLYHLAKSANVDISPFVPPVPLVPKTQPNPQNPQNPHNGDFGDIEDFIPTIPKQIHTNLPNLLQQIMAHLQNPVFTPKFDLL